MDEESVVAAVPEAFYPPSQKQMSIGREESISAAVGSTVSPPDAATHWLESAAAGMFILPAQRPPSHTGTAIGFNLLSHPHCHFLQPLLSITTRISLSRTLFALLPSFFSPLFQFSPLSCFLELCKTKGKRKELAYPYLFIQWDAAMDVQKVWSL